MQDQIEQTLMNLARSALHLHCSAEPTQWAIKYYYIIVPLLSEPPQPYFFIFPIPYLTNSLTQSVYPRDKPTTKSQRTRQLSQIPASYVVYPLLKVQIQSDYNKQLVYLMQPSPSKHKNRAPKDKADYQPLKLLYLAESNPEIQKLNHSSKKNPEPHPNQPPRSLFLRYPNTFRTVLAIILLSLIAYQFYQIHTHSSNLQQQINNQDNRYTLSDQQLKSVAKDVDQRKMVEAELTNRIDLLNAKIQDEQQEKTRKDELSVILASDLPPNQITPATTQQTNGFIIPTELWLFERDTPTYLQELMLSNNKHFAKQSNFRINTISISNYHAHLSLAGQLKVEAVLKTLQERKDNGDAGLQHHFTPIQRRLILFAILYEQGGVIIDRQLTLTENFDWINQIEDNLHTNRANANTPPQVTGFYSPFYSSPIRKQQKTRTPDMEEVQKYMVLFPALQGYFIAANAHSEFIGRLLEEMLVILASPASIAQDLQQNKYQYYNLDGKDIYYQYFPLAGQRVLQTKQRELDRDHTEKGTRSFAIDYYGLRLINCHYGPYKLGLTFQYVDPGRKIQNIAKYDLAEYEASVGPMRYLQMTTISGELNDFLTRIRDTQAKEQIMLGSFLQKVYFPTANQPFLYANPQKQVVNQTAPTWDSLPKIIWLYWDAGIAKAPVQVFLCVRNLRRTSLASNFQVRQVNDSNLNDYLDKTTQQRIQFSLRNGKIRIFQQTKSDLIRLALLHKYGGIYVDASVIAVQNFDWLVNIARFPSQYIFNRYGAVPSALMFWNPSFAGFLEWEVDKQANTKQGWRYSLENSIIVAVKESEFIKEWFDLLLELLLKPIEEVLAVFQQCNITSMKWTHLNEHYLLSMDTAKCVIGRREIMLGQQPRREYKNAMDYYKLWSMSSFIGPFKIRGNMNYANLDRNGNNPFFTRYSQQYVEGVTGKMHFLLKFISSTRQQILKFIERHFDKLKEETHSQSLFMKYLYETEGKFEKTGKGLVFRMNK